MNRATVARLLGEATEADLNGDVALHRRLVHEIASNLPEALSAATELLQGPDKDVWPTCVKVIAEIGFPRNADAIALLILHAADPNSPASFDATDTLRSLPQEAVVAALVGELWASSIQRDATGRRSVRDVCVVATQLGPAYCLGCAPMLVYNLSARDSTETEVKWALTVLEIVGLALATYAVPLLLALLVQITDEGVRTRIHALLGSFGEMLLLPYAKINL
jgi:HEAT repeat protein